MPSITLAQSQPDAWWNVLGGTWTQQGFGANAWTISLPGDRTVTYASSTGFTAPRFAGDIPGGVVDSVELRQGGVLVATLGDLRPLGLGAAAIPATTTALAATPLSFIGSPSRDEITGGPGGDTLQGGSGDDDFHGGAGNDSLQGGAGNDFLQGDAGADTVSGGDGNDYIYGAGLGTAPGASGGDLLNGDAGDDQIHAVGGQAFGGAGNDQLSGSDAELHGGDGDDTLTISASAPLAVYGDEGADTFYVGEGTGALTVNGGGGADTVQIAYKGGSLSATQVGAVALVGVERVVLLTAGDIDLRTVPAGFEVSYTGASRVTGTGGADSVVASGGDDSVAAGAGNDTILGQGGSDTLAGGAGDDVLDGGTQGWGTQSNTLPYFPHTTYTQVFPQAYDLVDYSGAASGVRVDLRLTTAQDTGEGRDTLVGFEGAIGSAFDDVLIGAPGDQSVSYWAYANSIHYSPVEALATRLYGKGGNDSLVGTAGADTLDGGAGDDTVQGGDGADLIDAGTGANLLTGGAGGDTFRIALDGSADALVDFSGAQGDLLVLTDAAGQVLSGLAGTLILDNVARELRWDADGDAGPQSAVTVALMGNVGDLREGYFAGGFQPGVLRTIAADGSVTNITPSWVAQRMQVGTAGADTLVGTSFADTLSGGAGDDAIDGRRGADLLTGGAGADKFLIYQGGDPATITDFSATEGDRLLLVDGQGNIASGAAGILIYDAGTKALSWDPDSDAGASPPVVVAYLRGPDVTLTQSSFAAGFQPSAVRYDDPVYGRQDTVFDWGSQSFSSATATYVGGALRSYDIRYDDGGQSLRTNDLGNLAPDWATVVAEYDPQQRLFAYSVYHDDGSRTLWLYDTTNTKPWSRVLEEYDPLGRLSQQSAALDDGTAWERHIDTYDTQPWAYYIDNFKDGALLNHTFYRENGTVFG